MQLTVKGKHLDVGDALRTHVEENLNALAAKYFNNPIEATVVFSKEKNHLFKVDISLHASKGIILQAQHEASDPYPAFDVASERMGKRLRRYKDKLKDHHRAAEESALKSVPAAYTTFNVADEVENDNGEPAVVAEMETSVLTLSVSDAVMRMELGDLPALMFFNPSHGGLNMVYRRRDGNIGWVDPQGNVKKAV